MSKKGNESFFDSPNSDTHTHIHILFMSELHLSNSARVDEHKDVCMCSSECMQQWCSTGRQCGISDMAGIGQFSQ